MRLQRWRFIASRKHGKPRDRAGPALYTLSPGATPEPRAERRAGCNVSPVTCPLSLYPLTAASPIRFAAAASPGTASSSMNITWSWFSTT